MNKPFLSNEDLIERLATLLHKYEQKQQHAQPSNWIGTKEALRLLELSSSKSLLKLYRSGIIGRSKISGRFFYSRIEIEKLMLSNYKKLTLKF